MTRRAMSPEYAARLRSALEKSLMKHLLRVAATIPANVTVAALMVVVFEIITKHVSARYKAEVIAKCRAAIDAAENVRR